jgi:hypothetical protein
MKSEFEYYTAPDNENLKFYKLHELDKSYLTSIAELLAEEWKERTAQGQITFSHVIKFQK